MGQAAQTIPNQDNGAMALLASLFQNSSSLFGSGTTTETSSTAPVNLSPLDPKTMDDMISNILDKAKMAFGPNIANSVAGGNRALSDTTLSDLQSRAQGYATAAAAGAKIDAITKQNQIIAEVAARNTTRSTKTNASPVGKTLQTLGLGATAYSLYKKANEKGATGASGLSDIYNSIFAGNTPAGTFGTEVGTGGGTIGGTTQTLGNVEGGFNVGDIFGGATTAFDTLTPSVGLDAATAGFDFGNTISAGGLASDAAVSAASDVGSSSLFESIFGFSNPVNDFVSNIPVVGDVYNAVENIPVIGDVADVASNFSYICSELKRKNNLSFIRGAKITLLFYKTHSKESIMGYRTWSPYFVKLMQKSRLITKFGQNMVIAWENQLRGKCSILGYFLHYIVRPISYLLGSYILSKKTVTPFGVKNHG